MKVQSHLLAAQRAHNEIQIPFVFGNIDAIAEIFFIHRLFHHLLLLSEYTPHTATACSAAIPLRPTVPTDDCFLFG
jgi:hypothetical protein